MTRPVIPIVPAPEAINLGDWHTPDDCSGIASIRTEMGTMSARMDSMEATIAANYQIAANDRTTIKQILYDNYSKAQADRDSIAQQLQVSQQQQYELAEQMREPIEIIGSMKGFVKGVLATGKWARRIIMWFFPAATAIIGFIAAWQQLTGG